MLNKLKSALGKTITNIILSVILAFVIEAALFLILVSTRAWFAVAMLATSLGISDVNYFFGLLYFTLFFACLILLSFVSLAEKKNQDLAKKYNMFRCIQRGDDAFHEGQVCESCKEKILNEYAIPNEEFYESHPYYKDKPFCGRCANQFQMSAIYHKQLEESKMQNIKT